jgi:hypothetical protein
MTKNDITTVARRIVLAMACGVALLSIAVFVMLFVVQHASFIEAAMQAAPLAAAAMLGMCGGAMARYLALR